MHRYYTLKWQLIQIFWLFVFLFFRFVHLQVFISDKIKKIFSTNKLSFFSTMGPCSQNPPSGNEVNEDTSMATVQETDDAVAMVVPPTTQYQSEMVETYTPDTVVTYSPTPENVVAYTSESVATNAPGNIIYGPEAIVMYAPDLEGEC